mmetsp:Transcript_4363/g.11434  ORF Transcript_4363/g.11434 Transcript_4363/m.11434 type:complete len:222 (-) Transcript_4363:1377-2042(-)
MTNVCCHVVVCHAVHFHFAHCCAVRCCQFDILLICFVVAPMMIVHRRTSVAHLRHMVSIGYGHVDLVFANFPGHAFGKVSPCVGANQYRWSAHLSWFRVNARLRSYHPNCQMFVVAVMMAMSPSILAQFFDESAPMASGSFFQRRMCELLRRDDDALMANTPHSLILTMSSAACHWCAVRFSADAVATVISMVISMVMAHLMFCWSGDVGAHCQAPWRSFP